MSINNIKWNFLLRLPLLWSGTGELEQNFTLLRFIYSDWDSLYIMNYPGLWKNWQSSLYVHTRSYPWISVTSNTSSFKLLNAPFNNGIWYFRNASRSSSKNIVKWRSNPLINVLKIIIQAISGWFTRIVYLKNVTFKQLLRTWHIALLPQKSINGVLLNFMKPYTNYFFNVRFTHIAFKYKILLHVALTYLEVRVLLKSNRRRDLCAWQGINFVGGTTHSPHPLLGCHSPSSCVTCSEFHGVHCCALRTTRWMHGCIKVKR
jgi:hypothetical protein